MVDDRLNARAKRKREEKEAEEAKKKRLGTSRISDQFGDLKRAMGDVTADQWEAIPDIGDPSLRGKKKEIDRPMPVPDSLLVAGATGAMGFGGGGVSGNSGAGGGGGGGGGGAASTSGAADIRGISEARGQMLSLRLGRMSDSVSGQTVVDPRGYLTAMTSESVTSASDVADIKKARLLLRSVTQTNPAHAPGWIAAARLEETVQDLIGARRLLASGILHCPQDEDIWLEAERLATPALARSVLADAVAALPHSVKLWLRASDRETDSSVKRAVLRRALTQTPTSEALWRAAVALEEPAEARIMLARAVECVPASLDLWLALARLETADNARKVLNAARAALPTEPGVWFAAMRLEEATGTNNEMLAKIATRALKTLRSRDALIDRDVWISTAEEAAKAGAPATCAALVSAVLDVGVEEDDRRRTWLADAAALASRGSHHAARSVYARLLQVFPSDADLWREAAEFERSTGNSVGVDQILRRAVTQCPRAQVLWLMAAKEAWVSEGDVTRARDILREAFAANPESESVWLAAAKLESESGEVPRARALLERARAAAPSARVWLKSASLERDAGNVTAEAALLAEGTSRFPSAWKLWAMVGQMEERKGQVEKARNAYAATRTVRGCARAAPLWLAAAVLEESIGGGGSASFARARSILEAARLAAPRDDSLILAAVRLERRSGAFKQADTLLAAALKDSPDSGALIAEDIDTAPRHARKRKAVDALSKNDAEPLVNLAVARLFAADHKPDKARKFFSRACALNKDYGDAWAAAYAFEIALGTPESQQEAIAIEAAAVLAQPRHGEVWQRISKSPRTGRVSISEILKKCAAVIAAANLANVERAAAAH